LNDLEKLFDIVGVMYRRITDFSIFEEEKEHIDCKHDNS
jgi:superfamily II DNA or RNA helicase